MPTVSERELIERAIAGDRNAFRGIVENHQAFARSLSYRFVGNPADSLFLIVLFITEYYHAPQIQQSQLQVEAESREKVVALDSKVFYRRGNREKESGEASLVSLYQCLQACQRLDGECIACKIKYARINKHYENI